MSEQHPSLEIKTTRNFTSWMTEQNISLMVTTYEAGKLFSFGVGDNGKLSIFERTMPRCMGLYATEDAQSVYVSTLYQIWRLERAIQQQKFHEGFDAIYIPQSCSVTGDIDVHDLALTGNDDVMFVSTLFSCIAKTSDAYSFTPVWKPRFISKLAAEDRCHLNGLAIRDGVPRYATSVSQSDINNGWRDQREDGGVVIDLTNNEVVADTLSMPHSPRWYDGKLWVLNSGQGEFGTIDLTTGKFEPVAFCPGYLRGMAFIDHYALVGISRPRKDGSFSGLPLDENLSKRGAKPRCGIQIINLRTGDIEHSLDFEGIVSELYDLAVLPGVQRPKTIGFQSDEIHHVLSVGSDDHTSLTGDRSS